MKYLTAFILFLSVSFMCFSQEDEKTEGDREEVDTIISVVTDSDSFHITKRKRYKRIKTRYGLVDYGINSWSTPTTYRLENGIDPFELRQFKSTNLNIHLIQQRIGLVDRNVNFIYGLTFESHRYFFDNPVVLLEDTPNVSFAFNSDVRYKKNRLTSNYFSVPFMLNFKSNPKHTYRSFHLSIGGYAGLLLNANFKTKIKGGNKDKIKDNFGLNTVHAGIRAEIGYGPCIFYSTYSLTEFFDPDKNAGYELTPFAIGLMLLPF